MNETIQDWMERERAAKRKIETLIAERLAEIEALDTQGRWNVAGVIAALVVVACVGAVIWTVMP